MKKTLFSALIAGAMAFTISAVFCIPALANCPLNTGKPACDRPAPPMDWKKPMTPEEHIKFREAKKAEFEARLQLTESQKAKLEKIKADEKKALEPYREKINKEQEKLNSLFAKEREIREQSMKQFEATLTAKQKEELEKIKSEVKEEMEKMTPHTFPNPKFGPKPMCPPDCKCKCHDTKNAEPADCKCPCHKQPVKK